MKSGISEDAGEQATLQWLSDLDWAIPLGLGRPPAEHEGADAVFVKVRLKSLGHPDRQWGY